ncbi:MAG: restriction endonuclease [Myxococcaceae bacterium]|nr:restriction endonuclease [Myxococcaceae bacterium]
MLEDLLALIFKSIPGFEGTMTDRRSADEQLDLLIPNDSPATFWQQTQSQYFLGECKNWSGPVDPKEMDAFYQKIARRYGRCRLGFFIAVGGFTRGFGNVLQAERKGDILIVPIDRAQLDELVHAKDRNAKLMEFNHRAVMDASKDT